MGLDDLQRRDARIAQLEAIGCRNRTREQDHELGRLIDARDQLWRRLASRIAAARDRARELETYARPTGPPLPESAPHG